MTNKELMDVIKTSVDKAHNLLSVESGQTLTKLHFDMACKYISMADSAAIELLRRINIQIANETTSVTSR